MHQASMHQCITACRRRRSRSLAAKKHRATHQAAGPIQHINRRLVLRLLRLPLDLRHGEAQQELSKSRDYQDTFRPRTETQVSNKHHCDHPRKHHCWHMSVSKSEGINIQGKARNMAQRHVSSGSLHLPQRVLALLPQTTLQLVLFLAHLFQPLPQLTLVSLMQAALQLRRVRRSRDRAAT